MSNGSQKSGPAKPASGDWEKKVQEHVRELPPVPGAAPSEEPQVDEVVEEDETPGP